MTVTERAREILADLDTRAAYYIGKHGSRYADIYDRIWALLEPDACAEHRAGCPQGAH